LLGKVKLKTREFYGFKRSLKGARRRTFLIKVIFSFWGGFFLIQATFFKRILDQEKTSETGSQNMKQKILFASNSDKIYFSALRCSLWIK